MQFRLNKKNEDALSKLGFNTGAAINQWISQRINGSSGVYETTKVENKAKEGGVVDNEIITILKTIDKKIDGFISAEMVDISDDNQEVVEKHVENTGFVLSEKQQTLADTIISYIKENQMDDGSWDVGYDTRDFNVVMSYMGNRMGMGKVVGVMFDYIKENTKDLF